MRVKRSKGAGQIADLILGIARRGRPSWRSRSRALFLREPKNGLAERAICTLRRPVGRGGTGSYSSAEAAGGEPLVGRRRRLSERSISSSSGSGMRVKAMRIGA